MYIEDFKSWEDVQKEYEMNEPEPDKVFLAYYTQENYSGDSLVVYKSGAEYFLNRGSHCSCHGLEQQWDPTPMGDREAIMAYFDRVEKNGYGIEQTMAPGIMKALREDTDEVMNKTDVKKATELMKKMTTAGTAVQAASSKVKSAKTAYDQAMLADRAAKDEYYRLQSELLAITNKTFNGQAPQF